MLKRYIFYVPWTRLTNDGKFDWDFTAEWRTRVHRSLTSHLCSTSHHFRSHRKFQCLRYGLYTPSSSNSPKLPNCKSQHLRYSANCLYSLGFNRCPHKKGVDFKRNSLPSQRVLHADVSFGVFNVSDNYKRQQVFFDRTPQWKRHIFQQTKDKSDGGTSVVSRRV